MQPQKFHTSFAVGLSFIVLLISCTRTPSPKVLATVQSHSITEPQFVKRLIDFQLSAGVNDNLRVRRQVLDGMINEWLLADYADSLKVTKEDAYKRMFAYRRKKHILALWKKHEILDTIVVSETDIRQTYLHFNEKVFARHLFAPTRKKADSLYQMLKQGASFEELALKNFKDSRLALNGGALGYFRMGEMDPAFEDVAFSLSPGDISPPVQTANGYSIVKVEDRQRRPIITETEYAVKKKYIRRYVKWKKQELARRHYIRKRIDTAGLKFKKAGLTVLLEFIKQANVSGDYQGNLLFANKSDIPTEQQHLPCLQFQNQTWTVQQALAQLSNIKEKQFKLINDIPSLKLALRGLVARELLYREAVEKGYDKTDEAIQGFAEAAKQAKIRYVLGKISDSLTASEEELTRYFTQHQKEYYYPEEVKTQVLVVKDSLLALKLKNAAESGADFNRLASRYSLLAGDPDNGIIDWSPRGKFNKFADEIFALRPGEIAGPFHKGNIFFLVKMLDHRAKRPKRFDEVKQEVEANILFLKRQKQYQALLRRLRKQAHLSIDQDALQKVSLK